ncbi:hypothetical protein K3495_g3172 [Podosphaera aphanis]|nr:hypothetical protein K3495_g3172 [Podosphaera aphanis]
MANVDGSNDAPAISRRPSTPPISTSPGRPRQSSVPPSDEPIVPHHDTEARPSGLRRRPSNGVPPRRSMQSDFERPEIYEQTSRRHIRTSSNNTNHDADNRAEYQYHPDATERSRPPRAYRNMEGLDRQTSSAARTLYDESRIDLERGDDWRSEHRRARSPDSYSTDGHNHYRRNEKSHFKDMTPEERAAAMRLPWTHWMNSDFKNLAFIGEFFGTTLFLFFSFAGAQVANMQTVAPGEDGMPGFDVTVFLYISTVFGFSLAVNVWIFYRISGALFNPAATLGMVLIGAIPIVRALFMVVAQIAGGIAASALVLGLFPLPLNVRTSLSGGTSLVQGVFIEAILTAELVFTIFMLAKEKHRATFVAPIGIGLALFVALLAGGFFTGGSLNPARSFGPCVVTGTFEDEHWIYWVGPTLGALFAVLLFKILKLLEYEMANPGQDGDDRNDPTKNPEKYNELLRNREKRGC